MTTSLWRHTAKKVRSCVHSQRQIRCIRRSLTKEATKTLIGSFICTRLDYCNAVFTGLSGSTTNHLDSDQHASDPIISGRHKYDHITPVLRDELHWLPVLPHITHKLCLTTYKAINDIAPGHLTVMYIPISTNSTRLRLRSADSGQLVLPRTKTEFRKRTFAYAGLHAWYDLPMSLRSIKTLRFQIGSKNASVPMCIST